MRKPGTPSLSGICSTVCHLSHSGLSEAFRPCQIVRNPFDALVSYFWWTFYGPDIVKMSLVTNPDGQTQLAIIGKDKPAKYDYNFGGGR